MTRSPACHGVAKRRRDYDTEVSVDGLSGGLYRIQARIDPASAEAVDIVILGYEITYNARESTIRAKRDPDGDEARHNAKPVYRIARREDGIQFDALVDRTSIELYPNDGERYIFYSRLKLYEHSGAHLTFKTRGGGNGRHPIRAFIQPRVGLEELSVVGIARAFGPIDRTDTVCLLE